MEKNFWLILTVLLLFGFVVKTIRLGTPTTMYYDEVYHAYTAEQMLENNRDVYDPFATPPDNFAYEWTHPYLGKILIAGSICLFGNNGYGWRLSSVLFGTFALLLVALLVLQLFGSRLIALTAVFFLTIEGLFFTQSRVSMVDIHFIVFMLLTFILYWRWKEHPANIKKFLLIGVGLGLAAATKWTTLYIVIVLGVDFGVSYFKGFKLPQKNWFFWLFLMLCVIPGIIYVLSYAQMFWLGYGMEDFIELQKQMWAYHSKLDATHDYSSKPWQWIFNLRPVWFYVNYQGPKVANIYNVGNPIILWSGLVAVACSVYSLAKNWDSKLGFVVIAYFLLWLPWIFSPRIQFFHHYAPAVPFLCVLLARELLKIKKEISKNFLLINVLGFAVLWFVVFFPHLTAIPVNKWLSDHIYFVIPNWK